MTPGWLTVWLHVSDWMVDWLMDVSVWLINSLAHYLNSWLTGGLTVWLTKKWMAHYLNGWLTDGRGVWFINWLANF